MNPPRDTSSPAFALYNGSSLLNRFRSPVFGWMQLTALFFMLIEPLRTVRAVYVPDSNGNPYWLPLTSSDTESSGGPDWTDDGNGNPVWRDQYQAAVDAGQIVWWGGGNFLINGNWVNYPGQYHLAGNNDSDGDGIPDDLDPYSSDANNNTFYWNGGSFTINDSTAYFGAGYYSGSWSDSDGDGIPDSLDPYPSDSNNGNSSGSSFWWNGGTFTINNTSTYFGSGNYSGSWSDSDGDGIPDVADPYPYDSNNGNTVNLEFWWGGGTYLIDGASVTFSSGYYSGQWSDADGDGIPDCLDSYPNDSANNSAWWSGGSYLVDGAQVTYAGQYHRANAGDADTDGIPDDLDPYPNDPANNTFWWNGGWFEVDANQVYFPAQYYAGPGTDADGDGLPDVLDPYAHDASNNTFWWSGGNFLINGQYSYFSAQYYAGSALDTDGDGIPDVLDPYPNDPWNNTSFYWGGGTFAIDGQSVTFGGGTYGGFWNDRDNDGIPDVVDPYPDDGSNNTAWWNGGTFMIDGNWASFGGQYHRASSGDTDNDGIPDDLDPYLYDSNNNSFYWAGGSYTINNSTTYFSGQYYAGDGRDSDGDGIPDVVDPYSSDSNNGNSGGDPYFWWDGGTFTINNSPTYLNAGYYPGYWSDSDNDGIPDAADPYPSDANNNSQNFYWGGGWYTINNSSTFFSSNWYTGSWQDSDGDGIPDVVDPYPYDGNNGNSNSSWWDGGTFTIDGASTYIPGQYYSSWSDSDGDGIPDFADPYPNDPSNNTALWQGGTFLVATQWVTYSSTYHRANAGDVDYDGIPDDLDPYPNDPWNNTYFTWPSQPTSFTIDNHAQMFQPAVYGGLWADADGDGIPDVADPYLNDATNNNDSDSDGIPDRIEMQYGLDPHNANDAQTVRPDGLTNLQIYRAGLPLDTPPLDWWQDSDGDGMSDIYEIANGLDRQNPLDAADAPMGDFIFNVEKGYWGILVTTVVTDATQYYNMTGHAVGGLINDPNKSVQENDWDGDGISNQDEVLLFHSDPRDPSAKPDLQTIWLAFSEGKGSVTTRAHYFWLAGNAADSDSNGLPDAWEVQNFGHTGVDLYDDPDHDGLTNWQEFLNGTDPNNPDTDGDGISDKLEVLYGRNPRDPSDGIDSDHNGLPDWWEMQNFGHLGVDPNGDPDGDQIVNSQEFLNGTDPNDYYNGQLPTLTMVSGSYQRGEPNTWLPVPVSVRVNDGQVGAPVTFTADDPYAYYYGSGILLAPTADVNSASTSVTVSAVTEFVDSNETHFAVAQVYVFLPDHYNHTAYVQALVNTGGQSNSISTIAVGTKLGTDGHDEAFLLGADRYQDSLGAVLNDGTYVPAAYTNSLWAPGGIALAEFTIPATSSDPWWLVDITTNEKALGAAADLSSAVWEPNDLPMPAVNATLFLDAGEREHAFTIHSRVPGGEEHLQFAYAVPGAQYGYSDWDYYGSDADGNYYDMPSDSSVVTVPLGYQMEFWLTRDADGAESAHHFHQTQGFAGMAPAVWILSNSSTPSSGFPPLPPPSGRTLQTKHFRIGASRANDAFAVVHQDGYRVPVTLGDFGNAWDYDTVNSQPIGYESYRDGTAAIDVNQGVTWYLLDETINEAFPIGMPDAFDGAQPFVRVDVYAGRAGHTFKVHFYDQDDVEVANQETTINPPWLNFRYLQNADSSFWSVQYFSIDAPTWLDITPQGGCSLSITDETTAEESGKIGGAHGWHDLVTWWTPPDSIALKIASTRWYHDLWLRAANGDEFPITKYSTEGDISFDPNGNAWWNSYGYFNAAANYRKYVDFRVVDKSTGDSWNQDGTDMTSWVTYDAPHNLTAVATGKDGITLQWTAGYSIANVTGYEIRRNAAGSSTWEVVATVPKSTQTYTDHPSGTHRLDWGVSYTYRVQGTYNVGRTQSTSEVSAANSDSTRDSDGDGVADANEVTLYHSDPYNIDTNGDGFTDAEDIYWGIDPVAPLTDANNPFLWIDPSHHLAGPAPLLPDPAHPNPPVITLTKPLGATLVP